MEGVKDDILPTKIIASASVANAEIPTFTFPDITLKCSSE